MHNLLSKVLYAKGVSDPTELSDEERQQYLTWKEVLNKGELTIEDVKGFCRTQTDIIRQKWSDYNIDEKTKAGLIPYFTVYNSLLAAIESPNQAKVALEKHLEGLTK